MKKTWRRVLGSVATLLLLFAFFVWDAIRRAEAAIDAHERQVSLDIAALRVAHARRPPLAATLLTPYSEFTSSLPETERLQALMDSEVFYRYEQEDPNQGHIGSWARVFGYDTRVPIPTPSHTLAALSVPQHLVRGGGTGAARFRTLCERGAINFWRRHLEAHEFTSEELQEYAGLLKILQDQRPPFRQAIDEESAIRRSMALQVLRGGRPENHYPYREPGWRELYLWRVFVAKLLNSIDQTYREWAEAESLAPHLRTHEFKAVIHRISAARRELPEGPPIEAHYLELEVLRDWALLRLATAIAWFQVHHGQSPDSLDALVPTYIERLPTNPETGEPFVYSGGTLAATKGSGLSDNWRISRKTWK